MDDVSLIASADMFEKLAKKAEYSAGMLFYCPEDGSILLVKRSSKMRNPNLWDIPGGRSVKDDKDILYTAKRETTEELGKLPDKYKLLTKYVIQKKLKENSKYKYHVFIYTLTKESKNKWFSEIELDEENDKFGWFTLGKLPDNLRYDLSWLPDVISDKGRVKIASLQNIEYTLPRFEYKYLIPETLVPEIREYLEPYVLPDEHGKFYHIKNIYFDTKDLRFFKDHLLKDNRFKLRARKYNTSNDVFLEIKRKNDGHIIKERRKLEPNQYPAILFDENNDSKFVKLMDEYQASPIAVIEYLREAYFLKEDPTTRITFDRRLRYKPIKNALMDQTADQAIMPNNTVILEIKFYHEMPKKVKNFLKKFNLKRRPVSKYINAIIDTLYSDKNQIEMAPEQLADIFNILTRVQKSRKLI